MTGTVYIRKNGVPEIGGFQPVLHTTTAAEATANAQVISLGDLPTVEFHIVQIYRAGVNVIDVAPVTVVGNVLTITDGGTYAATAGDVVHILAAGTVAE